MERIKKSPRQRGKKIGKDIRQKYRNHAEHKVENIKKKTKDITLVIMDTTKLLADAQAVVADIQALTPVPANDPVVSITVTLQSGATQTFVPQA